MKITRHLKKAAAMLFAGAVSLSSIASPIAAQETEINVNNLEAGYTYEVPVILENKIPMPPVGNAIKKEAFDGNAIISVEEDGSQSVTLRLKTIEIDMSVMGMGKYYANITEIITVKGNVYGNSETSAEVISTRTAVKNSMQAPEKIETVVPAVLKFTMPKNSNETYDNDLLVYYSNDFMGEHSQGTLVFDYTNAKRIADTTMLETKITEAKAIKATDYTADSFAALQAVIQEAELFDASASHDEISAMTQKLNQAIASLEKAETEVPLPVPTPTPSPAPDIEEPQEPAGLDKDHLADGLYSVQINLWNANADKASMANVSFDQTAYIEVKDGVYTMYVNTHEMSFGTIKASLQKMKVEYAGTYKDAVVTGTNANGDPTGFRFELPNTEEFFRVYVNPMVAMMGNQDIAARIKVDYSTLKTEERMNPEITPVPERTDNQKQPTSEEKADDVIKQTASQKHGAASIITLMAAGLGLVFFMARRKSEAE